MVYETVRKKVLIIAEAGVNHNGDMKLARQLIDAAATAGADFVKFQTFQADKLVSKSAKKADYQIISSNDNSQYEMLKRLELSEQQHIELIGYCKEKGIEFLSTAFDLGSIDLLERLHINLYKIPSGEITNLPYLQKIGSLNKKVIISTGMAVLPEIQNAIAVLKEAGTKPENISVLHCTTDYPTAMTDVNLRVMPELAQTLNVKIGYSDHTLGIEVPIAAVAMGAEIIEKHFTIDRNLPGPDHKASLEPSELKSMVKAIRNIEVALGISEKTPTEVEKKNMLVARKSIHLSVAKKEGELIQINDLVMKRPGDGISPMKLNELIGRRLKEALPAEHKLRWEDVE